MKSIFVLSTCLFITRLLQAETLIIPAGQGGKLTIATGEVAIVTIYQQSPAPAPFLTDIVVSGVTNRLPLDPASGLPEGRPVALAGPMEILFKDSGSHLLSYTKLIGNSIKSQVLNNGHTNRISVPEGKTLRFFSFVPNALGFNASVGVRLEKGTNSFSLYSSASLRPGAEFTGPVDIVLSEYDSDIACVVSYYLTEDFLVLPDGGFLQGPTGAFEISVEKSADLTNWFPVMVQNTSNDQKAFYRLKLAK